MRQIHLSRPHSAGAIARSLVRLASGAVFISFGVGKFTSHTSEVASFRGYGLPSPDAFVYLIGVVEILGGLLLLCWLAARLANLVLAADMVGAIIVSGIAHGETISLTLAPTMLLATLYMIWQGPSFVRLSVRTPSSFGGGGGVGPLP